MSDIVERLREAKDDVALKSGMPYALLLLEAADEIERLRKQAVADVAVVNSFLAQRDQAEAEVERLRERITWLQEQLEELQKEKT